MSEFAEGLAVGMNENRGYGNGGFGNGWGDGWWILLLLLCGWGNNGWGGNGNQNVGYELGKVATTNDVAAGFNNSAVLGSLNDLKLGQSQGFAGVQQTLCQGFNGVNQTMMSGFHGVDNAICTLGYNTQAGFNSLSREIGDCCCATQRAIDSVKFENEKNTRDIIDSQRCGTDRILGYLANQELDRLRNEVQTLRFQASQASQNAFITANQEAQTAELIRRLGRDCPVPAYVVPNPNCCYNYSVNGFGYGNNGGCGCGC